MTTEPTAKAGHKGWAEKERARLGCVGQLVFTELQPQYYQFYHISNYFGPILHLPIHRLPPLARVYNLKLQKMQ